MHFGIALLFSIKSGEISDFSGAVQCNLKNAAD